MSVQEKKDGHVRKIKMDDGHEEPTKEKDKEGRERKWQIQSGENGWERRGELEKEEEENNIE